MRVIRCEDCSNFENGKCKEYEKERDLALNDCFHDHGFCKYTPKEQLKGE